MAQRLELLVASLHDLPLDAAKTEKKAEPREVDDPAMFQSSRAKDKAA